MANNKEEQTKKPSPKPNPDAPKKIAPSVETKTAIVPHFSKLLLAIAILSSALAIIALICAVYSLQTNKQLAAQATQEAHTLSTKLNNLKQQQLDTQSIGASVESLDKSQSELQSHLKALDQELRTAMQQRLYQKEDWLLLKARYYLELAQMNAQWSNDQQTTIGLLQQADALLSALSEQPVFAIRQAIAQEISHLKTQPKLDIAGLLSQIDAIQNNVSALPLKQPLAKAQTKTTPGQTSQWREQLRESINSLGNLIVIRRHDEAVEPLLSPLQHSLLEETIRLNLEEAEWALLQNNPEVYQLALTKTIKTIKRVFDEKAPATQAIIQQLQNLQQQKLILAKPKLDKALPLLNQLIKNKNVQSSASSLKEGELSQ
ncbi:uroporphyrinogen-III C-methyltransferase [Legionella hackeliae]|uniref:Uroporphyrinogen-III C-methyltransferase n=1 Tax=Legionella hackeliae TaxID=449 RepID=A0A0A8UXC7_LEGHA|nr:uroporphyrinogen-III C-methyltransferase [Legionella hackeliae]KTD09927.1 uroporphyrinogen III methylase [Legionella hackeliae]CEK11772.1 conserved protein of unknown function [Legionella hackeliae]STX48543.1 uroporphyrin-III C-methyltransferase [Legionella hackeliae]